MRYRVKIREEQARFIKGRDTRERADSQCEIINPTRKYDTLMVGPVDYQKAFDNVNLKIFWLLII